MARTYNLFLLRHGETTYPSSLAGHTDFLLSERGESQIAETLTNIPFETCVSSPLSRCCLPAEAFCQKHNLDIVIEPKIMEMNFGDWDGLPYDKLWSLPRPNIGDFWQSPFQHTPTNGESFEQFVSRIDSWWQLFVKNIEQDTLVMTHAGVIKVLLALILSEQKTPEQIAKIATTISIDYAQAIKVTVFNESGFEPHIQVKL